MARWTWQVIPGGDAQVGLGSGGGGEAPSPAPFSGGGEEGSGGGGGGVGMSSAAGGGGTPPAPRSQTHTRLFGTNKPCEEFNLQQLEKLRGERGDWACMRFELRMEWCGCGFNRQRWSHNPEGGIYDFQLVVVFSRRLSVACFWPEQSKRSRPCYIVDA